MEHIEIEKIVNAIENKQEHVVNNYLIEQWDTGVDHFIRVITKMRNFNSTMVDTYLDNAIQMNSFMKH